MQLCGLRSKLRNLLKNVSRFEKNFDTRTCNKWVKTAASIGANISRTIRLKAEVSASACVTPKPNASSLADSGGVPVTGR